MAWPNGNLAVLCALDVAAAGALATTVLALAPVERTCVDPLAGEPRATPGFASLAAPAASPACLRIRLR